jgi:hypothetical protein
MGLLGRRPLRNWTFGPACRQVAPRHFPDLSNSESHVRTHVTWLISSGNGAIAKGPMSSRVKAETVRLRPREVQ